MIHKIFNAGNVLGTADFLLMISVPAAVEGEAYITALVLLAAFAGCAYLTIKECGRIK